MELKVHCENEERFQALEIQAQKGGASYLRTMKQRDTYFQVPYGRLKLREWWLEGQESLVTVRRGGHLDAGNEVGSAGVTLIAYTRANAGGSRISDYLVSPVPEPETLRLVLTETLGTLVEVEKVRVLYAYGNTRIHLDTVQGLGSFVELETVIGEVTSLKDAMAEHQAVITALGLDVLPPVATSYSDLLISAEGDASAWED